MGALARVGGVRAGELCAVWAYDGPAEESQQGKGETAVKRGLSFMLRGVLGGLGRKKRREVDDLDRREVLQLYGSTRYCKEVDSLLQGGFPGTVGNWFGRSD